MQENIETDGVKLPNLDFLHQTNEANTSLSKMDIFWSVVSVLGRVISISINVNVAYEYFRKDKQNYFIWTIMCILVPATITSGLGLHMYLDDHKTKKRTEKKNCLEILIFIIIIPFFFRYFQTLIHAIRCKWAEIREFPEKQKEYYELMLHEDSDVAFLRLFECYLEAAPQKILQLTIVLSGEEQITWAQYLAIFWSIFSMAWCMASYYRCTRMNQPDKRDVTWCGTIVQIGWHYCVTISRILSIAIIASVFPIWTILAFSCHAFLMALWIFFIDRSPFCSATIFHSFLFSLVLGFIYIFTYILPRERRNTRYRYFIFYTISFLENSFCVTLYLIFVKNSIILGENVYLIILSCLSIFPFVVGISLMVIYYSYCHPNIISRKSFIVNEKGVTTVQNDDVSSIRNCL